MTFDQIKKHWGSVAKAAAAIGVTRPTVYDWERIGIPEDQQIKIQKLTKGELRIDAPILAKWRQALAA